MPINRDSLTPRQREVLGVIAREKSRSVKVPSFMDLANRLGMCYNAVREYMDIFVDRGYIVRPANRRNAYALTPKGERTVALDDFRAAVKNGRFQPWDGTPRRRREIRVKM